MTVSNNAQEIRNLLARIDQLVEKAGPAKSAEHEIDSGELSRLKIALRPLVSDELQGRFVQVLNKMQSGAAVSSAEAQLITVAFMSMADIIAGDPSLIGRLRNDIKKFSDTVADKDIAAKVNPNLEMR